MSWDRFPRLRSSVIKTSSPVDSAAMSSIDNSWAVLAIWIDDLNHPFGRTSAQDGKAALFQARRRRIRNCAETLGRHPAKDA